MIGLLGGIAAALAFAVGQDAPPPSALEFALTERTCDRLLATRATDINAHEACVTEQMTTLRADFGPDLGRLSAADRRKLDAICSPYSRAETRERYLDCVNGELGALRERMRRAKPTEAEIPAAAARAPALATPTAPAPARRSGLVWVLLIGGPVVALGAAAGFVVVRKRRRPVHLCTVCGGPVTDAGALCAACRHAAAEERRRATAEEKREAEELRQRALDAEEAARAQQRAAQLAIEEEARQRATEEQRRREEEASRRRAAVEASPRAGEEAFDPFTILGIAEGAGPEAIRAAYEEARKKYDADLVSHLGADVQRHYAEKAAAVERAYQMLTSTT
jgi:hypothetical protein